jgi:hypothetical protein
VRSGRPRERHYGPQPAGKPATEPQTSLTHDGLGMWLAAERDAAAESAMRDIIDLWRQQGYPDRRVKFDKKRYRLSGDWLRHRGPGTALAVAEALRVMGQIDEELFAELTRPARGKRSRAARAAAAPELTRSELGRG